MGAELGIELRLCNRLFLGIILAILAAGFTNPPIEASAFYVVHVHLQPYPDGTGKAAPFLNNEPSSHVVDIPVPSGSTPTVVHTGPAGIGVMSATGLLGALGEYMVPDTYANTANILSEAMTQYGYHLTTSNAPAYEYTSQSNNDVHVDVTLWDLGDKTLVQYWVTDLIPATVKSNYTPSLLLVIVVLALLINKIKIRAKRGNL